MQPIGKTVKKYFADNQSVIDCLRIGLVNYSALARRICEDAKIQKFDAVLMACRRQGERLLKLENDRYAAIKQLVRRAKITLQTKMAVVIIEKPRSFERIFSLQKLIKKEGSGDLSIIEGEDVVTFILSEEWLPEVRAAFKGRIVRVSEELVRLNMVFSEKIETTPGVTAYVYRLLADHGINILEEMSCWTDLMMMIEEKDMSVAADILGAER